MENYKIIINEPEVSSDEIAARKDFDVLLKKHHKTSRPFFKTPWFLSASILALGVAVYAFSYTTNHTDNSVVANIHSDPGKAVAEKKVPINKNNPIEVSVNKENKLDNIVFSEETKLKSNLTGKEVIEKRYSPKTHMPIDPGISINKNHSLPSTSNKSTLEDEIFPSSDNKIENASITSHTNNPILSQTENENLTASIIPNNILAGVIITNENIKTIDTIIENSANFTQDTLLTEEPLKTEITTEKTTTIDSVKLMNNNKPKYSKWAIGISFSPDYSYRVLKPFESGEIEYENLVDSLNLIEKGKLAFTFGISLSYKFNNKFSIRTGLYYSDKGIQSKGFVYRNGIYPGCNIFKKDLYNKTKFYFYEVPIIVSYNMALDAEKKFTLNLFIGGTASLNSQKHDFISRRWFDPIENDPNDESSYWIMYAGANSLMHIGYTAGFGFNIKATKRINIITEPVFKYYAHQFYPKNGIYICLGESDNPYSFGCNIGLNYNF